MPIDSIYCSLMGRAAVYTLKDASSIAAGDNELFVGLLQLQNNMKLVFISADGSEINIL